MKRFFYLHLYLIILNTGCNSEVETIQPEEENISESVYASGVIKSEHQYSVYASATGIVSDVLVKEGDVVKKGTTLLRLDNTTARLNVESARIAAEQSSVESNAERLSEAETAIRQAKEKMEYDASLLEKRRNLWSQNIGTRIELEGAELAYKNSKNNYEAAQLAYKNLQKQLRFQERQAQKNLSISKSQAANYAVTSDLDGKVYEVLVAKGELVTMQSPVAVIGNDSAFVLELQVDEYDISRIKPGQLVLLTMDSYKGEVYEAEVTKINPLMNSRTKSFTVEARFVKQPAVLYPNLTTEANIIIRTKEKALTIPRTYLLPGDSVLLKNGEKKKVTTGLKDYQKVEIINGLTKADIIQKPEE